MQKSLSEAALFYTRHGFSVLPAWHHNAGDKAKRPRITSWKHLQKSIASESEVRQWFSRNDRLLAVITGAVSGNLEGLDFDCKGRALAEWSGLVEEKAPGLTERLPLEYTPSGGAHVFYQSEEPIPGNQNLAFAAIEVEGPGEHEYNGKKFVAQEKAGRYYITPKTIETRGEGGYIIVAPSEGYEFQQLKLSQVPVLTAKEREVLIEAARQCNEWNPPARDSCPQKEAPPVRGHDTQPPTERLPGADFDNRGDVRDVLRKHGWTRNGTDKDGRELWVRPGKKPSASEKSATLMDGKVFYVWSRNAPPFEAERGYGPFAVYALLEHDGDFSVAARALSEKGYGARKEEPGKRKSMGLSLNELERKFSQRVEWLYKTHVPKGMPCIWNGREKIGKSSLCLIVAREILETTGEGTVVWLATEGAVLDTVHKMQKFGLDSPRFKIAQKSDESFRYQFNQDRDVRELDKLLADLPQPILSVFIDSIRGMQPFGDNDDRIGGIMHRVNGVVCDKHGAALEYIDHWGKTVKPELLDRNVGTTSKTAAVRHIVSVLRQSAHSRKILVASSNVINHEAIAPLIAYETESDILISEQFGEIEGTLQEKCEAWMIEVFSNHNEKLASEMYSEGARLGFREQLVREVKSRLGVPHKKGKDQRSFWLSPYSEDTTGSNLNRYNNSNDLTTAGFTAGQLPVSLPED